MVYSDKTPKGQPPTFLKKIGDIEVYEGMKARFTACASGYPEPEVEWFLNGDRIYPNERTQIEAEPNGKIEFCEIEMNCSLVKNLPKIKKKSSHLRFASFDNP